MAPRSCPASYSSERLPAALLGDPPHLAFLAKQVSGSHILTHLPENTFGFITLPRRLPPNLQEACIHRGTERKAGSRWPPPFKPRVKWASLVFNHFLVSAVLQFDGDSILTKTSTWLPVYFKHWGLKKSQVS